MYLQWLKDYKELEEQLIYLNWCLKESELELLRWTEGDLSNLNLSSQIESPNNASIGDSRIIALKDKIQKVKQEITLLNKQKMEILNLVDTFKGIDNQIVKLKYIDGVKLNDIAEIVGYSESYIKQRHAGIRNTLKIIEKHKLKS